MKRMGTSLGKRRDTKMKGGKGRGRGETRMKEEEEED